MKGRYPLTNVQTAMHRRLRALRENASWVDDMVAVIGRSESSGYFRWFDSGDIQSADHLRKIISIARRLPHIRFWLPTREYGMVEEVRRDGPFPGNLTIRLSAHMIDGPLPTALAKRMGVVVSGVTRGIPTCPSAQQNNKCGACRACWDSKQPVTYGLH